MTGATLDFLGGAGTVTGSRFLLSGDDRRVLVDCGLFQGLRELRRRNWDAFPVEPGSIDAIVLSHAHLDHCGYLPALVRDGFTGPVHCTEGTARLAGIVLHDSAHLLMEDTEHARRHGYSRHSEPRPLYTDGDVDRAIACVKTTPFDEQREVARGVRAMLQRAGHILGSASVLIDWDVDHKVLFSGDLGRPQHPLLCPPPPPPPADVVVVESTYGDRAHEPGNAADRLRDAIVRTVRRGGSVVIPAFAVDRTEVILMSLRALRRRGDIPDVPIFVDSPMALAALDVYREALRGHWPELRADIGTSDDPFDPGNLHELHTVDQSKTLNDPKWPCIIVSASGMVSGGRVLHHLEGLLPDARNTVVLAGYQAIGTRGRDLAEGARTVKIHGRYVPVRAQVVDVPMFSVHADGTEIVDWLGQADRAPDVCYVVHGEPSAAAALRDTIHTQLGWTSVVPRMGERVRLS